MPESKRRKAAYTAPDGGSTTAPAPRPTPRWWVPTMLTIMVLGLLWIVVFYVAGDRIPFMADLGAWNFLVGFGAMVAGLVMSMRWR